MKERKAAALEYAGGAGAPVIIALARGKLVDRLVQIAEECNIPVYRDTDLAEVLSAMNVGDEIPEKLYGAVAEVLAFCWRINDRLRNKLNLHWK